jgi:hypothetical protein
LNGCHARRQHLDCQQSPHFVASWLDRNQSTPELTSFDDCTWLGGLLGLPPLALPLLAVLLAITLAYAMATELLKRWVKPFSIASREAISRG